MWSRAKDAVEEGGIQKENEDEDEDEDEAKKRRRRMIMKFEVVRASHLVPSVPTLRTL